jgi:predicted RNA-binding Zn-ribbon protein involved in translation (DUF1610 family)
MVEVIRGSSNVSFAVTSTVGCSATASRIRCPGCGHEQILPEAGCRQLVLAFPWTSRF